jgi:hypothetical protein
MAEVIGLVLQGADVRLINIPAVSHSTEQLHRAWRQANESVRGAEERLVHAWAAFAAGKAGAPDKELLEGVARLRRVCDQRLSALLADFTETRPASGPSEHPGN